MASHVDSMVLLKFYFSWLINRWFMHQYFVNEDF